jgi:hypothetical protein
VTPRALARLLVAYFVLLAMACLSVRHAVSLSPCAPRDGETIRSAWRAGQLLGRSTDSDPGLTEQDATDVSVIDEKVVAEAPLAAASDLVLMTSLVAGRDGVRATLDGKTAYVTPDDLLSRGGYDHGLSIPSLTLSFGTDAELVLALLGERLGAPVPEVRARARLTRIRTVRSGAAPQPFASTTPDELTPEMMRTAALDAARFLARGVSVEGRFRYLVDAASNRSLGGYDLPRHAAAVYFLAQAAGLSHDEAIAGAALRGARYLRDRETTLCGSNRCVGTADIVDIGSSALTLIAFNELVRTNLDRSYRGAVEELARFLRSQQRPDGEFMHLYDRRAKKPIDLQFIYYSGEVTLALSRAYGQFHHPLDLEAASRGLAHIVGPAWSFFGDRYYFGEEHWTCQAMSELWAVAPDPKALSFCERWQAYGRKMMYGPGETPFDADGSYGVGPLVTPRYTPVASRCEAGIATLDAMTRAHADPAEQARLASQLRRSLALMIRVQLRPGPTHLFADPAAIYGAFPGSAVDWQLRNDYAQHAGSALIRAADFWSATVPGVRTP